MNEIFENVPGFYWSLQKREKPKLGVPQLWISFSSDFDKGYSAIHIIYPNGRVEFCDDNGEWFGAVTSRHCQEDALRACHKASYGNDEFVCNIE